MILVPEDGVALVTVLGTVPRGVPGTGCLCPEAATTLGAVVLVPEDGVALLTVPGALPRGVPGTGCLCPEEAATTLGAVDLTPAEVMKRCPVLVVDV